MPKVLNPDHVRAFVARDWKAVAASKREYWAERYREVGCTAAWDVSNGLLADVRARRPTFPSDDERAKDIEAHARLSRLLARAAHAVTGRPAAR